MSRMKPTDSAIPSSSKSSTLAYNTHKNAASVGGTFQTRLAHEPTAPSEERTPPLDSNQGRGRNGGESSLSHHGVYSVSRPKACQGITTRICCCQAPRPRSAIATARNSARPLFSVSCHSISGTESATMPAPHCTCSWPSLITAVRMAMAVSMLPCQDR